MGEGGLREEIDVSVDTLNYDPFQTLYFFTLFYSLLYACRTSPNLAWGGGEVSRIAAAPQWDLVQVTTATDDTGDIKNE